MSIYKEETKKILHDRISLVLGCDKCPEDFESEKEETREDVVSQALEAGWGVVDYASEFGGYAYNVKLVLCPTCLVGYNASTTNRGETWSIE